MGKTATNILALNAGQATGFFLQSEQYHGFELPEYFEFDELLHNVKEAVGDTPYEKCVKKDASPELLTGVNLDIMLNKDGRYAVRPIILANPFLYYFLVREICSEKAWQTVKELFAKYRVPHITACSLPVVPVKAEAFHKSATILNWWSGMEQRSIELSLEYRYMFVSDITNCYGSINPQTFDRAFTLKDTQHDTHSGSTVAKNIQRYLRAMQQGRNTGIPQGSAVFDFLAEIILGYSDLLFHEAIQREGVTAPYEIIRYRDDYRIFCNDRDELERLSYILQHVLESLSFRMNSKKTRISESIITDSIKPDKLAYIYNTPIFNKKGVDFDSFEKHLLYILLFSRKHPDSGSVKTMLSDIDKRIAAWLAPQDTEAAADTGAKAVKKKKTSRPRMLPGGSVRAMSAVCLQIALENIGCCHYALRVLSRMADSLADEAERWDIIGKVYAKLCHRPNSDYLQLWLQNITYQKDRRDGRSPYPVRLCRVVTGEDTELWNNSWLKEKYTKDFRQSAIINSEALKAVTPVITFRERGGYDEGISLDLSDYGIWDGDGPGCTAGGGKSARTSGGADTDGILDDNGGLTFHYDPETGSLTLADK